MSDSIENCSPALLKALVYAEKVESNRRAMMRRDDLMIHQFGESLRLVCSEEPCNVLHERIQFATEYRKIFELKNQETKIRRLRGLATVIAHWVKDLQLPRE